MVAIIGVRPISAHVSVASLQIGWFCELPQDSALSGECEQSRRLSEATPQRVIGAGRMGEAKYGVAGH